MGKDHLPTGVIEGTSCVLRFLDLPNEHHTSSFILYLLKFSLYSHAARKQLNISCKPFDDRTECFGSIYVKIHTMSCICQYYVGEVGRSREKALNSGNRVREVVEGLVAVSTAEGTVRYGAGLA